MRKTTYFNSEDIEGWPRAEELRPFFFAPPGREWFNSSGNDGALLTGEGLYGTGNGIESKTRVDVDLYLYGVLGLGVMLLYRKHGGGYRQNYSSKGDLSRLKDIVHDLHGGPIPVGLIVSFSKAYDAVKEFIETDGELPTCIEWVADQDLPPDTFPDPAAELEERFGKK